MSVTQPLSYKPRTDADKLDTILRRNPKICYIIAQRIVKELYCAVDEDYRILSEDEDGPSGADLIDAITSLISQQAKLQSGIERLQERRKRQKFRSGDRVTYARMCAMGHQRTRFIRSVTYRPDGEVRIRFEKGIPPISSDSATIEFAHTNAITSVGR